MRAPRAPFTNVADGTTIDSLQLEIRDSSDKAIKGLDALSKSLERIKKAASGGSTDKLAQSLKKLNEVINGTADKPSKFAQLQKSIAALSVTSPGLNKLTASLKSVNDSFAGIDTRSLTGSIAALDNFKDSAADFQRLGIDSVPIRVKVDSIDDAVSKIEQIKTEMEGVAGWQAVDFKNHFRDGELTAISAKLKEVKASVADNGIEAAFSRMVEREAAMSAEAVHVADAVRNITQEATGLSTPFVAASQASSQFSAKMSEATGAASSVKQTMEPLTSIVSQWVSPIDDSIRGMAGLSTQAQNTLSSFDRQYLAIQKMIAEITRAESAYIGMTKAGNVPPAALDKAALSLDFLGEKLKQAEDRANITRQKFMDLIPDSAQSEASQLGARLKESLGSIGPLAKRIFDGFGSGIGKVAGFISSISKRIKDMLPHTEKSVNVFARLGLTLKRLLLYRVLSNAMSAATQAIRDGVQNLARYSNEFNGVMSTFATGALTIKNSLGAMLAPVLEALVPLFQKLVGWITSAANAIGMFFAALGGKNTFTKAKEYAVDYADSLGGASDAAKELKGQLAGFDEINIIGPQSSGGGGAGGQDFGSMFEETPIPDIWQDAANDAFQLGNLLAKKIAEALGGINWGEVKNKAKEIAHNIGEFINGFIAEEPLWFELGEALGESLNTAFTFLKELAQTIKWHDLGEMLAYGLNTAISFWDPKLAGEAIFESVNGIADMILTFFRDTNWGELGAKVGTFLATIFEGTNFDQLGRAFAAKWNALIDFLADFISNTNWIGMGMSIGEGITAWFDEINWTKAGRTFSEGIQGIIATIVKAIQSTDWGLIGSYIGQFVASIDWAGITVFIGAGIYAALQAALELGPALIESAAKIVTGIAEGIAAALPQLIPMGVQLITTLLQSLVNTLPALTEGGLQIVTGLVEGVLAAIPVIINALPALVDGLLNFLLGAIPQFIEAGTAMFTALAEALPEIVTSITTVLPQLIDGIVGAILTNVPMIVEAGITMFTAIVQALPDIVSSIAQAVPTIISGVVGAITENLPTVIQCGIDLFMALVGAIPEIVAGITAVLPELITGITTAFTENAPAIMEAGILLMSSLVGNLPAIIEAVVGVLPELITSITTAVLENLPAIVEAGVQVFSGLVGNLPGIMAPITAAIPEIVSGVTRILSHTLCV